MTDSRTPASLTALVAGPATDAGASPGATDFGARLQVVGRYELREFIGAGAMGQVHRAFDPELQRDVAVKLIDSASYRGRAHEDVGDRLLREARAIAALSHPNVVAVHDAGRITHEGADGVYIVMEYVDGPDMRRWLERKRSRTEVLDVMLGAGRGLAAAHAAGVVHRDFKPGNVLVESSGRARVVDFGLAYLEHNPDDETPIEGGDGLGATRAAGTPAYMAPEVHDGQDAGPLSDQYCYCVTLFEALRGRRPFRADSMAELAIKKTRETLEGGGLPVPLLKIIKRGLSPRPSDRFADLDELLRAIERFAGRGRRRIIGSLAVGVVALSAVATRGATDPCDGYTARAERVWNDAVRSSMEADFLQTGAAAAEPLWTKTRERVDAVAGEWTATATEICAAPVETTGDAARAGQMACIEEEYVKLAELLDTLKGPLQEDWISRAPQSAESILPRHCLDVRQRGTRDGADKKQRDRQLHRADAMLSTSRIAAARALAEDVLAQARDAGDLDAEARAEYLRARIAADAVEPTRGIERLYAATLLAERAGSRELGFSIQKRLISELAFAGRLVEASRAVEYCERAMAEISVAPHLVATFRYNHATLAYTQPDDVRTLELLEIAEQELIAAFSPRSAWIAQVHNVRGSVLRRQDKYAAAAREFRTTVEIFEEARGSEHPQLVGMLGNEANALILAGDAATGLKRSERARTLLRATGRDGSPWSARYLRLSAHAHAELGDRERARSLLDEASALTDDDDEREQIAMLRSEYFGGPKGAK